MLIISLRFKKIKLHGQITRELLGLKCKIFRVLFLYKHKHTGRFSNLY